jgi:putative ABC transport system substrate-binding protein
MEDFVRKSLFAVVIICLLAVFFGNAPAAQSEGSKTIGVIWVGKSSMASRNFSGFYIRMKALAPKVKLRIYKEIPTMEQAKETFNRLQREVDAIVVFRSHGAQLLGMVQPEIPCFFGGASDPVALGALKEPDAPEGKVTGVTYFIPHERIFDLIHEALPNVKSVGFLGERGHPGTPIDRIGTRTECERRGIRYNESICSDSAELAAGAEDLVKKCDILIVSNQALVNRNISKILMVTNKTKTPLVSYVEQPVRVGAVLGISVDHVKLGSMLADSVYDVLFKGHSIKETPVKSELNPQILINESMMKFLGLNFPKSLLDRAVKIKE